MKSNLISTDKSVASNELGAINFSFFRNGVFGSLTYCLRRGIRAERRYRINVNKWDNLVFYFSLLSRFAVWIIIIFETSRERRSFANNKRWTMACLAQPGIQNERGRDVAFDVSKKCPVIYAQTKLIYSTGVIRDAFQNGLSFKSCVVSSSTRVYRLRAVIRSDRCARSVAVPKARGIHWFY